MVTRRRYKARAAAPAVAAAPAQAAPAAPPVEPGMAGGGGAGPLQAALQAQRHAEALQQQHAIRQQTGLAEPPLDPATRQAIDQHVDSLPGLSDWKRRFIKSHPTLLQQPYVRSAQHAHAMALHAGIVDDSPQMDSAILAGVAKDIEHHRQLSQLTSAQARPVNHQAHHDADQDVAELMREAEAHLAAHQPAAPIAPKPQRRSMPMQAPVSRDSPSVSGHRQDRTLSADERQIARSSMPHLPAAQAEYQYLLNRQRMREMKADGRIQGDG